MVSISCTRRLEFDAAHRLMGHEGLCKNLHGHRYVVEISCTADKLDSVGRVIDFSVIKEIVGGWISLHWDHACIINHHDRTLRQFLTDEKQRYYPMDGDPSVEQMSSTLLLVARELLQEEGISVSLIRIYETPNAWAEAV